MFPLHSLFPVFVLPGLQHQSCFRLCHRTNLNLRRRHLGVRLIANRLICTLPGRNWNSPGVQTNLSLNKCHELHFKAVLRRVPLAKRLHYQYRYTSNKMWLDGSISFNADMDKIKGKHARRFLFCLSTCSRSYHLLPVSEDPDVIESVIGLLR